MNLIQLAFVHQMDPRPIGGLTLGTLCIHLGQCLVKLLDLFLDRLQPLRMPTGLTYLFQVFLLIFCQLMLFIQGLKKGLS